MAGSYLRYGGVQLGTFAEPTGFAASRAISVVPIPCTDGTKTRERGGRTTTWAWRVHGLEGCADDFRMAVSWVQAITAVLDAGPKLLEYVHPDETAQTIGYAVCSSISSPRVRRGIATLDLSFTIDDFYDPEEA